MTIWLEKFENEISEDYVYNAYVGFKYLFCCNDIRFFQHAHKIHYKDGDIVVGSVQHCHFILNKLGIVPPNFYIPNGLEEYAGRDVRKGTIGEVYNLKKENIPFFIKPVNTKEFPAQTVDRFPLITHMGQQLTSEQECWISPVINFISEYRVFLIEGSAVGCQYYEGDFRVFPSWDVIDSAIRSLKTQPIGWCLDFGVTDDGRTLLIEANDGYSLGSYGLWAPTYSDLLAKRWKELSTK